MAREGKTSGTARAPEVFKVLHDGWALAHDPSGPAAMHLLALLSHLPDGIEALVALPGPSPHIIPNQVELLREDVPATASARLGWEQRGLPRAAKKAGAHLLHLVESHPPLSTPVPVVISPADSPARARPASTSERLRAALAQGAAGSVSALLWPEDLNSPDGWRQVYSLPPILPPAFCRETPPEAEIPSDYLLYNGPADEPTLLRLLAGWSWAGPAVGEQFPLVLAGLSETEQVLAQNLITQAGFESTTRLVPAVTEEDWAALYASASVVVNLGPLVPWGSPLLLAMARGKPLVAEESAQAGKRVGSTAYLVPSGDGRMLGAALTTLVVETEMAEGLGRSAAERAAAWDGAAFNDRLLAIYQTIVVQ